MNHHASRTVFIFTGPREDTIAGVRTGREADTALRGLNHIKGAEYLTIRPKSFRALLFIPRLLRYDFVVAQDNLLLGYVVSLCARVFRTKTRWIYIAMNSSTILKRHVSHPVRLFLLRKFWASYFRIACISREQIEDFARLGIARERLMFIPFGIDAGFFRSSGVSQEEDLIVSVGRDAGRDYATLFKAAERTAYPYVVVASHKTVPPGMPVPANVSVLYDRSLAEVRDLYARARLVVIASKDVQVPDGSDCSGQTVILDALSAGKAVIATHRPWISDYFIPGQDLVVVEPNNPEVLARAVDSLWRDAPRREQLAASGQAKVLARYTTEAFAKGLLALMKPAV